MPASSSKTGSRSRHRGDLEEEYGSAKVIFLSVRLKIMWSVLSFIFFIEKILRGTTCNFGQILYGHNFQTNSLKYIKVYIF